jgi:glutamate formiminotransferase/formiminotetrahydrofolate cyclodeaminase
MEVDGQAQVSMNLVDTEKTPLHRVFEVVKSEAAAHGVAPTWSELVGLIPERVLLEAGARHVQLRGFGRHMLLETKVREAVAGGESVDRFLSRVASPEPTPGGGSVAAHAGALAAALAQMVSGLTVGRKKYAMVEEEMHRIALEAAARRRTLSALVERDAAAYERVRAAYQLPKDTDAQQETRALAVRDALLFAAKVPLETAREAVAVAALAVALAERGNANAVSDACVAALLAEAACKGAVLNVRINVASLDDAGTAQGAALASEARRYLDAVSLHARLAEAAAEKAMEPA